MSSQRNGMVSGSGASKASAMFREVASPAKAVIVQGARSYRAFRKAYSEIAEDEARSAYLKHHPRAGQGYHQQ